MSRKDYTVAAEAIANLIEACTDDGRGDIRAEGIADTAKELADVFMADNPRFDRERFYFACAMTHDGNGGRPNGHDGNPRAYGARKVN